MYGKGDYISYSGHGICRIADKRCMDFGNGEQEYLVIEPIASGSATIYLPLQNPGLPSRMRPVLSREEIDAILSGVKNDRMPWIPDRKQRMSAFQQILSRRDTRQLLLLAGCLYRRKVEKGLSTSELDILHKVEGMIEQEFSFTLHISRAEIGQYIRERL